MQPHWHVDVEYAGVGSESSGTYEDWPAAAPSSMMMGEEMRMSERIWDPPETMLTRWLQCSQCSRCTDNVLKGEYSLVGLRGGNRSSATE